MQDLKTKEWHKVEAKEGDSIINLGDLLMRWSNNILKSNPHKVEYSNSDKSII